MTRTWTFLPAFLLLATLCYGQKKLILGTFNASIEDTHVVSIAPDANVSAQLATLPYAWTQQGQVNIARPFIRFDLSLLPKDAVVDEALLIYHYDPFSPTNLVDHTADNGFYVQRVIGPWDLTTITWNNQPPVSTTNSVYVPPASYSRQNYVINVTQLLKDLLADTVTGNQGFRLNLEYEMPYHVVVLSNSRHPDVSRHPQLWVRYSDPLVGTGEEELESAGPVFKVFPNPGSGQITLVSSQVPKGEFRAELYSLDGRLALQQAFSSSYVFLYAHALPAGNYVLKIRNDAGFEQVEKIVLTK